MNCRHCHTPLEHVFLDLGFAPPSNAYRKAEDLTKPELYFPLKLYVCDRCWLVQTEDYVHADELFSSNYAYFSSVSQIWCDHAAQYVEMITKRLPLGPESFVLEIGSNDGYLLKNFVTRRIPCLGIEPTASTAEAAERIGIPVLHQFFGKQLALELADEGKQADLIIGNNVYAHVPAINDFTAGLKAALKQGGTITLEFPHLMRIIEQVQFDTVYHEHYSYLSLSTVDRIFTSAGLRIYDVEELLTHGGSLRVYGCHADDPRPREGTVSTLVAEEEKQGLRSPSTYRGFQAKADGVKDNLITFLIQKKRQGKKVAAYGAAAKGNTLLNYAGIKPDLVPYVCDAAPSKHRKFLPGSHIPILPPEVLRQRRPDVVLILPWNIADEIVRQHAYVRDWGGVFYSAVPSLKLVKMKS
jgi:SAM-dependent methyltransferase